MTRMKKVWIDLDNTPHVPFFEPILLELKARGYPVLLTARDAFQVAELAEQKGLPVIKVGRHYGKHKLVKVAGLFYRALQLLPIVMREKPSIGVSHGARSQIILCNMLGIPTILLADYEFAKYPPLMRPTWEMVPEVIPDEALYCPPERVRKYPGIKEDVYVAKFKPNESIYQVLNLKKDCLLATVRPPATEAHYHNPESEALFDCLMNRLTGMPNVQTILLPRNKKQGELALATHPEWFVGAKTVIPATAVDGLNLLWFSDFVVSGGGTMNREAAALGVPVYSIFRGRTGAVDAYLEKTGKLIMIKTREEVMRDIQVVRRDKTFHADLAKPAALSSIVGHVESILKLSVTN